MALKIVDMLIVALVFMAIFPTIYLAFTNVTGYNGVTTTIFGLVPLLIVIGLLYYAWNSSGGNKGKGGLI